MHACRRAFLVLAACLAVLLGTAPAEAQQKPLAIVGAEIFDATGAPPFVGTVVVKNGRIERVVRGASRPRGAEIIEARGLALIPGLHDVHTHYFSIDRGRYNPSEVNWAFVSSGITAVADFSQGPEAVTPRRAWFASMPAPRVFVAGRISPLLANIWDWGDPATAYWADTPAAAASAVDDIQAHGFDVIKAFTDGWRYGSSPDVASMNEPTLTALVAKARAAHLPVLTHTLTLDRGKAAARAGVSVIAHAIQDRPVDQEFIDLVKANGVAYAPSLQTYETPRPGETLAAGDAGAAARLARFQLALANVKTMHDAGMKVVVGSDSGSARNPHALSAQREMELLVKAGLTPSEVLVAATVNSAQVLGQTDTGLIQPGQHADLVLIEGRPWADISDVRKVARTFIDGRTVYRKGEPLPALAETPPAVRLTAPLIADFEKPDLRTAAGALAVIDLDRNGERSWEVLNLVPREGGHALLATAKMSQRPDPRAEIVVPLVKGGIQPVDARAFKGVAFEARGAGDYTLAVMTPAGAWTANFSAGDGWAPKRIAFADLKGPPGAAWTGTDLLALRFVIQRPAGASTWLELDNLAFQ